MYDDWAAKHEGWAIFECDDGILRIQRLDSPKDVDEELPFDPLFPSDDHAIAFVEQKAKGGNM